MALNLDLRKTLDTTLEKKGIDKDIVMRVGFLIDTSWSMDKTFRDGSMTRLNERLMPIADRFDDNATMEVFSFSHRVRRLPDMTAANHLGYVDRIILPNFKELAGSTFYSEGLKAFLNEWEKEDPKKGFFGKLSDGISGKKSTSRQDKPAPGFIILQTDGDNHDPAETVNTLSRLKEANIFVCMLGTGHGVTMKLLNKYADVSSNVSAVHIPDILAQDDDTIYEHLLDEKAVSWLKTLG